jgi:hypothetical protein
MALPLGSGDAADPQALVKFADCDMYLCKKGPRAAASIHSIDAGP